MRPFFMSLSAAMSLLLPSQTAAGIESHGLYQLGKESCESVLFDPAFNAIGTENYLFYVDAVNMTRADFCACVATAFVDNEDEQMFRMELADDGDEEAEVFAAILAENLDGCLPPFSSLDRETQAIILNGDPDEDWDGDDVLDGDLVEWDEGIEDGPDWAKKPDQAHCEFAIDGLLEPDDFDRKSFTDWIAESGVGAPDLCSCSAVFFEDRKEDYAAEIEASTEGYWYHMLLSMDECRTAIYQPPLR